MIFGLIRGRSAPILHQRPAKSLILGGWGTVFATNSRHIYRPARYLQIALAFWVLSTVFECPIPAAILPQSCRYLAAPAGADRLPAGYRKSPADLPFFPGHYIDTHANAAGIW